MSTPIRARETADEAAVDAGDAGAMMTAEGCDGADLDDVDGNSDGRHGGGDLLEAGVAVNREDTMDPADQQPEQAAPRIRGPPARVKDLVQCLASQDGRRDLLARYLDIEDLLVLAQALELVRLYLQGRTQVRLNQSLSPTPRGFKLGHGSSPRPSRPHAGRCKRFYAALPVALVGVHL